MKLNSTLGLLFLASIAAAQSGGGSQGRTFTYFSTDAVQQDFSKAGAVMLNSTTNIAVNPYLYIHGNLGATWTVSGWGVGADTESDIVTFYHSETISFQFSQFDNPQKISGAKTGAQTISLQGQVQLYNSNTLDLLFDSGMLPIASLTTVFQPSGPIFTAKETGGIMRMNFSRQLSITPDVGPGEYENDGIITVIRN